MTVLFCFGRVFLSIHALDNIPLFDFEALKRMFLLIKTKPLIVQKGTFLNPNAIIRKENVWSAI